MILDRKSYVQRGQYRTSWDLFFFLSLLLNFIRGGMLNFLAVELWSNMHCLSRWSESNNQCY